MLDLATATNAVVALAGFFLVESLVLRNFLVGFCLYCGFVGLAFLFHSMLFVSQDSTSYMIMLKYCMYALSSSVVITLFQHKHGDRFLVELVRYVAIATALNCFVVIIFFAFPELAAAAGFFLNYGEQENWIEAGHRAFDVSIGGGAVASFVFSSVLFVYVAVMHEYEAKKFEFLVVSGLILLGLMITGRTGMFIFVFQLALYSLFSIKVVTFRAAILAIVAVSFLVLFFAMLKMYWDSFSVWFEWYFEWINNYIFYGEISSKSTDAIKDMYFFPDDGLTLLFGEANFGRHPQMPYVPSDVGYVRAIYGVGVFGAIAIYLVYFFPIFSASFINFSHNIKVLLALFLLGFALFNFKEMYLAGRSGSQLLFLVSFAILLHFEGLEKRANERQEVVL